MPFDPNKPVQTRDGRKARILATDIKRTNYPIVAATTDSDGSESVQCFSVHGKYYSQSGESYPNDLINLPEKRTGWLNVYPNECCSSFLYRTKSEADDSAEISRRIACVEIHYEVPAN